MINFRSEKGGVTVYVLAAMILVTIALVALYISITNKQVTQLEIAEQIKGIYEEDVANIDDLYNSLVKWKNWINGRNLFN